MSEITTAHLTTDMVLFADDERDVPHVLLIRRGWEPYAGYWALPGGYVDAGETFKAAAVRELQEETGLPDPRLRDQACRAIQQVGVYDQPDRDPRGRVISVAFTGWLAAMPTPTAGDDAREARWMPLFAVRSTRLAFDHADIVTRASARYGLRL